ncbi:MAG TPA: 50S ribosomal protein L11 methyltransferase [Candidatus Sulfomarinibacteraceae bacterium]|nr:50S ribosomal protein L11 methyltransferase [Candidatus Sulfomarinibacteraceae bacterium]
MAAFVKLDGMVAAGSEDALADALSLLPVLGIQIQPEAPGFARAEVWLARAHAGHADAVEGVLRGLGSPEVNRSDHEAEDWSARWRESLRPFPVGDTWWVDPHPGCPSQAPPGRRRLVVEPRAAFGSGTHETTQLVLLELEAVGCAGRRVLDVGTGSGILSVAAQQLGAESVVAVDIDPIAAWEASSTALAQDRPCPVLTVAGSVECCRDNAFDLVLGNMISAELEGLLGDIRRVLAAGGTAILAGLLESERRALVSSLGRWGLTVTGGRRLGEWASLVATGPGATG